MKISPYLVIVQERRPHFYTHFRHYLKVEYKLGKEGLLRSSDDVFFVTNVVGLFKRVILLSPVIFLPAEKHDPIQLGHKVGKMLGFEGTNAEELVAFLKFKSPKELLDATNILREAVKEVSTGYVQKFGSFGFGNSKKRLLFNEEIDS